jgi:hypothetical protein
MIYNNQFKKPAPPSPGDKCIDLLHQQFLELFSKVNAAEMLAAYAQESAENYLKLMRTYTAFNRCALAWAKFQVENGQYNNGLRPFESPEEYSEFLRAWMASYGVTSPEPAPAQPQDADQVPQVDAGQVTAEAVVGRPATAEPPGAEAEAVVGRVPSPGAAGEESEYPVGESESPSALKQ